MTEIPIEKFNPAGPTPDEVRVIPAVKDNLHAPPRYGNQEELDNMRSMPFTLRRRDGMSIRRFILYRPQPPEDYIRDGLTNAGLKPDIEGVEFSDGTVVIRWMVKDRQSHAIWENFDTFNAVHGHPEYGTRLVWIDP